MYILGLKLIHADKNGQLVATKEQTTVYKPASVWIHSGKRDVLFVFKSFIIPEMVQAVVILPRERQGPVHPA